MQSVTFHFNEVTESKPREGQMILAYNARSEEAFICLYEDERFWQDEDRCDGVTHWADLRSPLIELKF